MTLNLPEWLDEKFLQTCLRGADEDNQILVESFEVFPVVPPGNNYGSCLWRVKVGYKEKNISDSHNLSLIVKAPLTDGPFKDLFDLTEPTFYKKFLQIASSKFSLKYRFAPRTYFSSIPNVIVLEDLTTQGYSMADRTKLLDFYHCRLYVIASATFHALSVAIHKKQPELVESLGEEKMFSNDKSLAPIKKLLMSGICQLADQMKSIDEYQKYSNLVHNASNILWDVLVDAHKQSKILNTLHQGDPWTTNMMFKYDSTGKVQDIKLLDFQALRYSSPVNDLIFFIWTSANHEVRENCLKELYHLYCDTLNGRLEEFLCPERLSYEQLLDNIKNLKPLAFVLTASFYPLMISKTPVDFNSLMSKDFDGSDNIYLDYYNKEYCEHQLPRLLKQMESIGVFDYLETH